MNGIRLLQKLVGFLCQRIALFLFRADIHQCHLRIFDTENIFYIDRAHLCKLLQIFGLAIHICAAVQQEGKACFCGQAGTQSGTLHTGQAPDNQQCACQQCACAARRNNRIRFAVFHQIQRNHQRRILFAANRHRRRFIRTDDLGSLYDFNSFLIILIFCQLRTKLLRGANQLNIYIQFLHCIHCTLDGFHGRIIAAHCVQCYCNSFSHIFSTLLWFFIHIFQYTYFSRKKQSFFTITKGRSKDRPQSKSN